MSSIKTETFSTTAIKKNRPPCELRCKVEVGASLSANQSSQRKDDTNTLESQRYIYDDKILYAKVENVPQYLN